jgi:hypothetical protein
MPADPVDSCPVPARTAMEELVKLDGVGGFIVLTPCNVIVLGRGLSPNQLTCWFLEHDAPPSMRRALFGMRIVLPHPRRTRNTPHPNKANSLNGRVDRRQPASWW